MKKQKALLIIVIFMGLMILAGLCLLGYGIAINMNKLT